MMTKRLIDVDDAKIQEVREVLGTKTLKATVDAALDEVIALEKRRLSLLDLDGLSDLADKAARERAWR